MNSLASPLSQPLGTDEDFDALLPLKTRMLSSRHWTPVSIAVRAAEYLAQHEATKVLDIGAGVGKFCLVAASHSPKGEFFGVEQRESLVRLSKKLAQRCQIQRAHFIHANMLNIDFSNYDAFYFFNAFEETLDLTDKIDEDVQYNPNQYLDYTQYIHDQFEMLPIGTRIVTYCSPNSIIPEHYVMIASDVKGKLKFWEKKY